MKKFTLYWTNGKKQIIEGSDIANAFNNAGYSLGALGALDFYVYGEDDDYIWNKETKQWNRINPIIDLSLFKTC